MRNVRVGPPKVKVVSKIRRTREQAYGKTWDKTSSVIRKEAGNRCEECGTLGSAENRLETHHVIPVSRGGRTIPFHLKCICEICHAKKPGHKHLTKSKGIKPRKAPVLKLAKKWF